MTYGNIEINGMTDREHAEIHDNAQYVSTHHTMKDLYPNLDAYKRLDSVFVIQELQTNKQLMITGTTQSRISFVKPDMVDGDVVYRCTVKDTNKVITLNTNSSVMVYIPLK